MKIGKHFHLKDMIEGDAARKAGVYNFPNLIQLRAMKFLIDKILDPLCEHLGSPIRINSGFRNRELLERIGGAPGLATGGAVDIEIPGKSAEDIIEAVLEAALPFDLMVGESNGTLHIAWAEDHRAGTILWKGKTGTKPWKKKKAPKKLEASK